ncbi:MAG: hypothetical protein AB7I04_00845 [Pseudomonadales bacterium]
MDRQRGFALVTATVLTLMGFGCTPPNIDELDRDIQKASSRIEEVESELSKYNGGVIHSILLVRKQLNSTTREMLEQKRASLLYWIDLQYPVGGDIPVAASAERLQEILADMEKLKTKIETERTKVSGGLIGVLKLTEVATLELSLATVEHSYFAEKYGLPIWYKVPGQQQVDEKPVVEISPEEL